MFFVWSDFIIFPLKIQIYLLVPNWSSKIIQNLVENLIPEVPHKFEVVIY